MLEPTYPLRTARLDLRPYRPGDLDDVRAMQTREEVTRYLYWDVMTEDEVRESLAKKIGRVALRNEWVKGEWCDELAYALLEDEWRASVCVTDTVTRSSPGQCAATGPAGRIGG